MECSHICHGLYKRLLVEDFTGIVHSVFNSSFNVLDDNQQLITFLNAKRPMSPNSIKIGENVSYHSLGIKPKQTVYFSREIVEVKDSNIKFFLKELELWEKGPNLSFRRDNKVNILTKLNRMGEILSKEGKKDGIYPLIGSLENSLEGLEVLFDSNHTTSNRDDFIKQRFIKFIESYIEEDLVKLSKNSVDIIGYGVGLTPSMDDFLSGIMISRIYLSYYLGLKMVYAYKINEAIIKELNNKTTMVSQELLRFSSVGEANDYVKDLMVSFLGISPMKVFIDNLEKVLSIGETSGTDMLLGIYIGSRIILNSF